MLFVLSIAKDGRYTQVFRIYNFSKFVISKFCVAGRGSRLIPESIESGVNLEPRSATKNLLITNSEKL